MSPGDALRTYLLTKTGLTDLVSTRIHRGNAVQGSALPYVTYSLQGKETEHTAEGAASVAVYFFEVNCWGKTPTAAEAVYEQVRLAIDGYRGALDTGKFAHRCFMTGASDLGPRPTSGDEQGHYGISADLEIAYTETVTEF